MPPLPSGGATAPCPRGPMLPVHAAPSRATKASPARPRACCCAPRGPRSRREQDGGSLVQLMGLFLSKSPQPVQQPVIARPATWSEIVLGRKPQRQLHDPAPFCEN